MGVISILMGIIAFFTFTGAGAILGNAMINLKTTVAKTFTWLEGVSNASVMVGAVGILGFIGLLIGIDLIVTGLTYNKVCKIQKRIRRM